MSKKIKIKTTSGSGSLFATWEQCEHWELLFCFSAIFCSCPMTPMTGADRATFMAARGQWEAAHMAHGLRGALS